MRALLIVCIARSAFCVAALNLVLRAIYRSVDHCGVANGQLIKENSPIATYYDGKSVAEQNSIDLGTFPARVGCEIMLYVNR